MFATSWEQLTAEQRRALAALSVFRGGFTVQAALAVAQTSVLDLAALVEKSFLHRAGEGRYEIHELLRQFAAEYLPNPDTIHARHAAYYLAYLAAQTPGLNGPTPQETLATLRRDLDNLRQSWQWAVTRAEANLLAQGMDGLTQLMVFNGTNQEGEIALTQALTALSTRSGQQATRSMLESYLAWMRIGMGKNQAAAQNIQNALTLSTEVRDAASRAYALSIDGWLAQTQGRFSEAEAALHEAISLFEQTNNPLQCSLAYVRLGSVAWRRGDFESALAYYLQSLHLEQSLNNKRGLTRAYGGIGLAYFNLGKFEDALAYLGQALQLDRELGNQPGVSRHLGNIGTTYMQQGNYPEALKCFQEARGMAQKAQNKNELAIWLGNIALILLAQKEYTEALSFFDDAIQMQRETGDRFNLCESLLGKAEIYLLQNREASPLIEEGGRLSDEIQRQDTQLRARLLTARQMAKTAPEAARPHLQSLLDVFPDPESRARIFYELWRADPHPEDAQQALTLYESCLARVPRIEYITRLAEIRKTL
ncbi:MAG TPA: tetratricopeptide repeat protein [Anaerolineales bacterium]|nr:tetratricopeptide repeat protein [Anaerolineales bacterium]